VSGQIATEFGLRWPLAAKDGRDNLKRAFRATGCAVCGVRYPEVDWSDLHIDHIDPADKPRGSVISGRHGSSDALNNGRGNNSAEALLGELLKCQVLCRKHHKGPDGKHGKNGNGNGATAEQLELFMPDSEYRRGPWKVT
jgi:hypothetical protein